MTSIQPQRLAAVLGAGLLATGLAAHAANRDPSLAGEVMVKLITTDALAPLLAKYPLVQIDAFGARPIYRLQITGTATVAQMVKKLTAEPSVLIAEPNYLHRDPESRKNNPWAIGTQQAYVDQWAPQALKLPEAHLLSTGTGVRVAVLDTGIDAAHPAFAGKLLPGFDFVDFDNDPSEMGTVADAGFGHGTHVAGLVALTAPDARIMPIRVLDADGMGNGWVLAEALLYAVDPDGNPLTDDGAQVVNMSLGSLSRTHLFDDIAMLTTCNIPAVPEPGVDFTDPGYDGDKQRCLASRGTVIVAAAGNNGNDKAREYPAAESAYGELAVGASASNRRLASFSNFGSWVNLAAPGDGITSTFPWGAYATWGGTSMAAPFVAGTAALVRSANPGLATKELARRLERTSSLLCRTDIGQVDPVAALKNIEPANQRCR